MSEMFQCGDQSALVTYLYDECTPDERETIAAHLARCVACAAEISGLTSTRQALAQWTPPQIDLGLQITRKGADAIAPPPGTVLAFRRPEDESPEQRTSWWKAPLPAWAQVAAALVIFAAGLSVGFMRNGEPAPAPPQVVTKAPSPVVTPVSTGPSKSDLAELEQRLRSEMAQLRLSSAPQPAPVPVRSVDDDAIMRRVQTLLEEQRIDFTERLVRQQSVFEAQRRADNEAMGRSVGQIGTELRQHRQAIDGIAVRVSQPR